jgi:hypothetical protein
MSCRNVDCKEDYCQAIFLLAILTHFDSLKNQDIGKRFCNCTNNSEAHMTKLTLLMVFFLVSCSHTPNIAGKWQEPGTTSSIEFGRNGTFTAIDEMGMTVSGNYTILANEKIRFEIKHPNSSDEVIIGSFAVLDDGLILTLDDDKEVLTYKKMNTTTTK